MTQYSVGIFVRTPGWSATKKRLAKQIGGYAATCLYELSLDCMAELAQNLVSSDTNVYWAVAEEEALRDPYWTATGLPALFTGTGGGLGNRLSRIYSRLLKCGDVAVLIGSDIPQLTSAQLVPAFRQAEQGTVIGPANDGGFYMFAGSDPLLRRIWNSVEYSTSHTLEQLIAVLDRPVQLVDTQPDFDELSSLAEVIEAMPEVPSQAQRAFIRYAKDLLGSDDQLLRLGSAKNQR